MRTYFKQGAILRCIDVETDSVEEAIHAVYCWAFENKIKQSIGPVLALIDSSDAASTRWLGIRDGGEGA